MAVENPSGDTRVLWLTRRLLVRLVSAMTKAIDKEIKADPPVDAMQQVTPPSTSPLQTEEPAVVVDATAVEWLGNRVDLKVSNDTLELILFCHDDCASLPLPRSKAQQWLRIMYRFFNVADWPHSGSPLWLETAAPMDKRQVH